MFFYIQTPNQNSIDYH